MNAAASHIGELLNTLTSLPVERRCEYLRQQGDARELLAELIEEVSRRTAIDAAHAIQSADVVVNLADRIGSQLDRARARRAHARALSYTGRFDEALWATGEGIRLAEESGSLIEAGRARLASMHALGELGRLDEAIAAGEAARQGFLEAGEPALAARAEINLGGAHQRRDDPATAVRCFERARPHLVNEPLMLGHLESNRGEALLALNDFDGAQEAFHAARAALMKANATLTAAIAEGNLADLAARQGQLPRAIHYFEQARRGLESAGAEGHLARLVAERADAMAVLGMPSEAITEYQHALERLDNCGLQLEAARARSGLGVALMRAGRMAQAEKHLSAAADTYEKLGHITARAMVDLWRAEGAIQNAGAETEHDAIHAQVQQALTALQDRPAESIAGRNLLARLDMESGKFEAADAQLQAAYEIAQRLDAAPLLADVLFLRGSLRRRQQRLEDAIADFSAAIAQVERVRGALQAERFRAAYLGRRSMIYETLIATHLDCGDRMSNARAFEVAEQAKSRSLLEQMQGILSVGEKVPEESSGEAAAEQSLLEALTRARAKLSGLYSRLHDHKPVDGATSRNWQSAVHECERQIDALEQRLAATRGVGHLYAPTIQCEDVHRMLKADEALIEYFVAGDEVLAFVLTSREVHSFRRLANVSQIAEGLQRLHFQINRALRPGAMEGARGERLISEARRELAALETMTTGPLRGAIEAAKRLIIVPHGPLHLLPFHALWDGRQYLVESHEVCYAPSASLLAHLISRARDGEAPGQPCVIGVADDVAPQIAEEARLVAEILNVDASSTLIGAAAGAAAVKPLLERASVIHLACHGRFASDTPMGSGIQLADRWLTVRDIYSLGLKADLVTLSGCETGLSAIDAGDELMGLLRGFLVAGAASMVVSLWLVNDAATLEFMSGFYGFLRHNSPARRNLAAVFREAQVRMIQKHPHPAFWAPFILVGKSHA